MPRPKSASAKRTPPAAKSHKRQLSSSATPAATTPGSRASKRLKESTNNTPTTAKKSKYFEGSESEEEPASDDDAVSGYDDEYASIGEPSSASPSVTASEDEEDYDSEEDRKPKKNRGRKPAASGATGLVAGAIEKGKELWRQGVKTGLGPGKQVFIERPKPRGDGGIKYVPERIHPNTMAFLTDLKKNNDREWLKSECSNAIPNWDCASCAQDSIPTT